MKPKGIASILGRALTVLLAIVAIILAPAVLLFRLFSSFREVIIVKYGLNHSLPAIRRMKYSEEQNKFAAMQKVLIGQGCDFRKKSVDQIARDLIAPISLHFQSPKVILVDYARRCIFRSLSLQSDFSPAWIPYLVSLEPEGGFLLDDGTINFQAVSQSKLNDFAAFQNALQGLFIATDGTPTALAVKINAKVLKNQKRLLEIVANHASQLKAFEHLILSMLKDLEDVNNLHDKRPVKANRAFIADFRKVLKHPVYQAIKFSSEQPVVALLHHLAAAIWNDVHILPQYKAVGEAIISDGQLKLSENQPSNASLTNLLRASQAVIAKRHYANDSWISKIGYALTHFWHVMGTLASEGGFVRHIPALLGVDQYDSHGTLSNNPSIQGTSFWEGPSVKGRVNNCYGGTPTIGDHLIAPEFTALLQAVENNLLASKEFFSQDIPLKVIYNSLQNIDKCHGEGPRSHAIMHMNEAYPLSFSGAILAKDTAIYQMKSPEHVVFEGGGQFAVVLKEKLMQGLLSPEKSGHGFFFFRQGYQWEQLFDLILKHVSLKFEALGYSDDLTVRSKLQAAYQEYVYSLLIAVFECQQLANLNAAGFDDPLITEITACKENIDRGGMENTKYMYLRLPLMPERLMPLSGLQQLEYLIGIMNSRSISARDRAILKERMPQVLAFIELVSPADFNRTLAQLLKELNLPAKLTYVPDLYRT